jgi:carbohydrate binding protein with CBM4/9 domain
VSIPQPPRRRVGLHEGRFAGELFMHARCDPPGGARRHCLAWQTAFMRPGRISRTIGTMAPRSLRLRYARALPILLAIVVASAVTAALALLVLPNDDRDDGAVPAARVDENDGPLGVAVPTDTGAMGGEDRDASPPAAPAGINATPTEVMPTPTARGIRRPSPTADPTPTQGPVLASANLVGNGGFADGMDGWYVEGDITVADGIGRSGGSAARIGARGYADDVIAATAGRTYRLQAWGNVSQEGDSGVVGISYLDAAGNRREQEEPPPLVFDGTTLTRRSVRFTPPADAATVRVYLWKQPGPAALIVDDVSVREFASADDPSPTPGDA